ncbi:hypothetical protein CFP56_021586 [Quercus suber]|uniref:Uncharacterized protein n=1 Tax=Quercus suber TaxID=58331 RepID=A0AAW0LYK7_QUESU
MSVDPPSTNSMLLGSSNDEAEDLGSGFDDYEILNREKEEAKPNPFYVQNKQANKPLHQNP